MNPKTYMYIGKAYAKKAQAKGMDAFGKMQKSKIYTDASSSISELSAKYKKLPKNYKTGIKVAGATAVVGSAYAAGKSNRKG
jgi:hypothetical protein|tara:strand:+ start:304 stop:549 length:246 start_codon:yes stop_codon:yes gene_type:complete